MGYFALLGIIIFISMFYNGYQTFKINHFKKEYDKLVKENEQLKEQLKQLSK